MRGVWNAFDQPSLSVEFVESWLTNTTNLVRYVRNLFPSSLVAWHTTAMPLLNGDGTTWHPPLGKRAFIAQLNAAGRFLSTRLGLMLLDYEMMVQGFHLPPGDSGRDFPYYLMDNSHPSEELALEIINVILNILEELH